MPFVDDKMPKLVLVTGANGYVGSSLVKTLLEEGHRVRGTVRDVSDEKKTAPLKAMRNASTHLELVLLELTGPDDTFDKAMEGVEWVMHSASPVSQSTKNEQAIIRPAVEGTENLLRAAAATPSVRKFILTSSISAVYPGHPQVSFSEDDWTNLNDPHLLPYDKAKTLAEKAAWNFMKEHNPGFTLTSINPSVVLGPVAHENTASSAQILYCPLLGEPCFVDFYMPTVDVRDVVRAHIQAARLPEAAGKRFILNQSEGGGFWYTDIAKILKREFEPMGYNVRTWVLPKVLCWILSWFSAELASILKSFQQEIALDNERSKSILHIEYRPAEQTIIDGAHSLIEHRIVPRTDGYREPGRKD